MSGGPIGGGLDVTVRLNEGVVLSGRAAYYGARPNPGALARAARREAYEGRSRLESAAGGAEAMLRYALEMMVDAFLLDRRGNAALFVEAHRLGALLAERFSCRWTEKRGLYENPCGVLALHSRIGLSPGGRTWGRCSVCGAEDFQCDHVPGKVYDGVHCHRDIYRWDAEEISFTPQPRDPRCFRVRELVRKSKLQRRDPLCSHCSRCTGRAEPTAEDLDPSMWSSNREELFAETERVSRDALSLDTLAA